MQLLEIERELSGANGEAAMLRYDHQLEMLDGRLADALQLGLAPDDYTKAEQLKKAVLIARKLLRLSVQRENPPAGGAV